MTRSGRPKISKPQPAWQTLHGMLAIALLATLAMLSSGCARSAGSATIDQIGAELNAVLPTVSARDTERTISENATFREVFFSLFPQFRP